ncbi:MAG TPA: ATP synthase F0 subunit B [Pyrinomonadaceae bacterium]
MPDGTLFVHIAIILLMIYVLNRTLFKPINRVLDERDRRTRGSSNESKDILRRVDENLSRYERSLREARAESYRLLEQQRAAAMRVRQGKIEEVREKAARSIEQEKSLIRAQTEEARKSLEEEARRVAASVSTQILGRPASDTPMQGTHI